MTEIKSPRIDISVVGNHHIGKTQLICSWLSLTHGAIITPDVYSKIFWIDDVSLQLSIHEISSKDEFVSLKQRQNRIFHAIVYVYSLENNQSKDAILEWIDYMKPYINAATYPVILALSNNKVYGASSSVHGIPHYELSTQPSEMDKLLKFTSMVTDEAYKAHHKNNHINEVINDGQDHMDIFNSGSQQPLLTTSSSDVTTIDKWYHNKYQTNGTQCCSII